MNQDTLQTLKDELASGKVKKTARFVSRSRDWMPWIAHPVTARIEVGLFREFYDWPEVPSFAIEWLTGSEKDTIQLRSQSGAWLALPVMPELTELLNSVGSMEEDNLPSPDKLWDELMIKGFVEDDFGEDREDELPLPPEEPREHPIWLADEAEWLGPHVGRTFRFLALLKQFLADQDAANVLAIDFRAGYRDSAFHRLWECMDDDQVETRHMEAAGRMEASEVPYLCTDTLAYLLAAVEDGERAAAKCGVDLAVMMSPSGKRLLTLREPISSVVIQLWNADDDEDQDRLKAEADRVGAGLGLVVDWDTYPHRLQLLDNEEYRVHGVDP